MTTIRIGIDAMGGDFAPGSTVGGAIEALKELPDHVRLVLIGDQDKIHDVLSSHQADSSSFDIIHAPDTIEMGEHPTKAFAKKPNSSISVGFGMLQKNNIQAFASVGNSGAMLVGGFYTVKAVPGVIRPSITAQLPMFDGRRGLLLDVGVNADCKPDVLLQFGILGSLYAKHVYGIEKPKVALLNIGEEEGKGNMLVQAAYQLLKDSSDFDFIGNIEGRDLLFTEADVIVTDGFTGNVVLKQFEGMYELVTKRLGLEHDYLDKFNYENYGGTPILGMNSNVIIGHGISNTRAIKNMIIHAYEVTDANLVDKIKEAFLV
jgi:glycerol-3-phosphate acyltransferase PlsX